MNWLDITLIVVIIILVILGIVGLISFCLDYEVGVGILIFVLMLTFAFFIGFLPFLVVDKGSGSTIGTITSVDQNFFGTTALYIKTSENSQEEYCIENKDVSNKAKELIGKNVKVEYGTRVGLYSTGRCSQAPIEKIEEIKER